MVIAYLRVSTEKQQLDNQRREIAMFANSQNIKIDEWKEEIISGTTEEGLRVLGDVMKKLEEGDTLIISEVSRLSRKLMDVMNIMGRLMKNNVKVYCIKENFILADDISSKVLIFAFGVTSEIERGLISTRTKEALARKKSEGIVLGRPLGSCYKIQGLVKNQEKILQLLRNNISKSKIASSFGVSRPTLYKYLKNIAPKE